MQIRQTLLGFLAGTVSFCLIFVTDISYAQNIDWKVYHQDLVEKPDPVNLKSLGGGGRPGEHVQHTADGLKLSLGTENSRANHCGVEFMQILGGDFDVSAEYKIVDLPRPPSGEGAGIKISIRDSNQEWASLQRVMFAKSGSNYVAHRAYLHEKSSYKHESHKIPTEALIGILRVQRRGDTLTLFASENGSSEFIPLQQFQFTTNDIVELSFVAQTGGVDTPVEALWTSIEVNAETLHSKYKDQTSQSRRAVLLFLSLLVIVAAVGFVFWKKYRS